MFSSNPDEIERIGIIYEAAIAQQEALQDSIKLMAGLLAEMKSQPEVTSKALQRVASGTVSGWMDQAGQDAIKRAVTTANSAAAEFSTLAKQASTDAKAACYAADSALSGVRWWAFAAIFLGGIACGSLGLWLMHKPVAEPSPVTLDAGKVADYLKPALLEACKRK